MGSFGFETAGQENINMSVNKGQTTDVISCAQHIKNCLLESVMLRPRRRIFKFHIHCQNRRMLFIFLHTATFRKRARGWSSNRASCVFKPAHT